jgi:hypothetical protein
LRPESLDVRLSALEDIDFLIFVSLVNVWRRLEAARCCVSKSSTCEPEPYLMNRMRVRGWLLF